MRKKKVISLMMASAMALSLCACSSTQSTAPETSVEKDITETETEVSKIEAEETIVAQDYEMGTIVANFNVPDNWPGYNITIELYNETIGDFYEMYCYRQNDYIAKESLPKGMYTVDIVMAAGDARGDYPLQASKQSLDLVNNYAETFDITYVGESLMVEEDGAKEEVNLENVEGIPVDFNELVNAGVIDSETATAVQAYLSEISLDDLMELVEVSGPGYADSGSVSIDKAIEKLITDGIITEDQAKAVSDYLSPGVK